LILRTSAIGEIDAIITGNNGSQRGIRTTKPWLRATAIGLTEEMVMTNFQDATPSSLRRSAEPSRFAQQLVNRAQRPVVMAGGAARAAALSKGRFSRLPQEPEDARITGVTRSLQRRLLALNLPGTLLPVGQIVKAKIA
jgi:hypothetical protein